MLRLTPKSRTMRRAFSSLGVLALLVGCAPAPGAMTPQAAPPSPLTPLSVQGVLTATVEKAVFEKSAFHEVRTELFMSLQIVPVSEAERLAGAMQIIGLIPDDANADRFGIAMSPEDEGVTHLAGFSTPDFLKDYSHLFVAKRGGVEATRAVYENDDDGPYMRLSFPQEASGPITIEARDEGIAFARASETAVFRRLQIDEGAIAELEDAKDAVVEVGVTNQNGEPIEGLERDFFKLTLSDPTKPGATPLVVPYAALETLDKGMYRIRFPFPPMEGTGTMRFTMEIVNPALPITATFYRR